MSDISLEIPLAPFGFGGFRQSHVTGCSGIHELADGEDRSAFTGGIAPFENADHAAPGVLEPVLQLDELDLQAFERLLILIRLHLFGIGIAAGLQRIVVNPVGQLRIVYVELSRLSGDIELYRLVTGFPSAFYLSFC